MSLISLIMIRYINSDSIFSQNSKEDFSGNNRQNYLVIFFYFFLLCVWNLKNCRFGRDEYLWAYPKWRIYLVQPCSRKIYIFITESFPRGEEKNQGPVSIERNCGTHSHGQGREDRWILIQEGGRRWREKVCLYVRNGNWRQGRRQKHQLGPRESHSSLWTSK